MKKKMYKFYNEEGLFLHGCIRKNGIVYFSGVSKKLIETFYEYKSIK